MASPFGPVLGVGAPTPSCRPDSQRRDSRAGTCRTWRRMVSGELLRVAVRGAKPLGTVMRTVWGRAAAAVGAVAVTTVVGAQTPAAPKVAAFAADRLARIDVVMNEYVTRGALPGSVVLVLHDGVPVYNKAFGWADKESGRKMTTDALFRIASQTKAITSTAIMMLWEEGKLMPTDRVSRYVPSFSSSWVAVRADNALGMELVPAKRAITIKDLLTHTSGMSYGTDARVAKLYEANGFGPAAGLGWYFADKDEPICDAIDRLGTLPLVAQPGEAWVYGYSTDILGCIVERASGQPLDVFIRERITKPLGMTDTFFWVPGDKASRLTTVYASGPDGLAVRAPEGPKGQGEYVGGPKRALSGGAGLISTARDYARFLEMIRQGGALGGVRLLSPKTASLMTLNASGTLHSSTGMGYSMGFETTEFFGGNGLSSGGAYGWGGAYGSVYRVDPVDKITMVFLMQLMPNMTDIREKFPTLVYQAFVRKP